jgi:16S rRNA (guanine966-N2)-methyltransferase
MRILAGQFKGKNLSAGSDLSIRPITNRLKEIIFSVINDFIYDKIILDLFSGSGSLGIEAISRGAAHVTFVEKEKSSIRILTKNVNDLKVDQDFIKIINLDVMNFINRSNNKYNLIFSDPPFKYVFLQQLTNQIFFGKLLDLQGLMVIHHEIDNPLQTENVPYSLLKQKKIGRSILSFISKEANDV